MTRNNLWDVIIVGGSYAGLSAAMSLGRSLRHTLVIDAGKPCNRQTPHSHNFLTQDGNPPAQINALARQQLEAYQTVSFVEDLAVSGRKSGSLFEITTAPGQTFKAKKLILATGINDVMPPVKGFSECWGISVVHCPYCHGYEFRGQETGIMVNGDRALHLVSLIRNLTDKLTLLTSGTPDFAPDQLQKLEKYGIRVIETQVTEMAHSNGHISHVVFADRSSEAFAAVYAALPFTHHSDIAATLGCALNAQGYIQIDPMQQTTVPGVYACGDSTTPLRSVANAVAGGNFTGALVNRALAEEAF